MTRIRLPCTILVFQCVLCLRASTTLGSVWPMPSSYNTTLQWQSVDVTRFRFQVVGSQTCDLLQSAFNRSIQLMQSEYQSLVGTSGASSGGLTVLKVNLTGVCEQWPSFNMDESYTLSVTSNDSVLTANSVWGVLRGLETFSQLIYLQLPGTAGMAINNTAIMDSPRFRWRGIMLDTSRHFIPKTSILRTLDAMAYNKLNVFHWHIVDDVSFPYQSRQFPNLSDKGAFEKTTHVYTPIDVQAIVEYARQRGIRVVPEFDTPRHAQSWGKGQPKLMTKCSYNGNYPYDNDTVNPSLTSTYTFLAAFFKEVSQVFNDQYVHLGGDEVDYDCWASNPGIKAFMTSQKYGTDYSKLESYYFRKLIASIKSLNRTGIVWDDVFQNNVQVDPATIMEVWHDDVGDTTMSDVTAAGFKAIYAGMKWYLSANCWTTAWPDYYSVEPLNLVGPDKSKQNLVVGGEAVMWTEYVDSTNLDSQMWMKGSAVAERLWSPASVKDVTAATDRLDEHRCRMVRRGINAAPFRMGFCLHES